MLKRFIAAALLAVAPMLQAFAVGPEVARAIDELPGKAAEVGYPVSLGLEFEFQNKNDALATHLSFVASGIRPPEFGIAEVMEFDGLEPAEGRQPRSTRWFFRSKPYRIESPEQFAQELQKLRMVKLDGIILFHTKLDNGVNAPRPVPVPN